MTKLIALAPLALLASPAFAAEFSGPRIEAHVGWDRVNAKVSDRTGSVKGHDTGIAYGGGVGYDLRRGNVVFGVEASLEDSSTKQCDAAGTERICLNANRDFEIGGRIGFVAGQRALVYAKAAYANVRIGVDYTDRAFPADNFSVHDDRSGYRIGGGVEFALTPKAFVKAEYRYSDYEDYKFAGERAGFTRHQAVAGFGYRF